MLRILFMCLVLMAVQRISLYQHQNHSQGRSEKLESSLLFLLHPACLTWF